MVKAVGLLSSKSHSTSIEKSGTVAKSNRPARQERLVVIRFRLADDSVPASFFGSMKENLRDAQRTIIAFQRDEVGGTVIGGDNFHSRDQGIP